MQKEPFEVLGDRRKENRQEIKAKKAAQIATADQMARCIFEVQKSYAYTGCAELRKCSEDAQNEKEVKQGLEAEMQEIKDKLEDLSSALQAKKLVFRDLEEKVEQIEIKNAQPKGEADKLRYQSATKVTQQGKLYKHI